MALMFPIKFTKFLFETQNSNDHLGPRVFIPGDDENCSPKSGDTAYVSKDTRLIFRRVKIKDNVEREHVDIFFIVRQSPLANSLQHYVLKENEVIPDHKSMPQYVRFSPEWRISVSNRSHHPELEPMQQFITLKKASLTINNAKFTPVYVTGYIAPSCEVIRKRHVLGKGAFGQIVHDPGKEYVTKLFTSGRFKDDEDTKHKWLLSKAENEQNTKLKSFLQNHTLLYKIGDDPVRIKVCEGISLDQWCTIIHNRYRKTLAGNFHVQIMIYNVFCVGVEMIEAFDPLKVFHHDVKPANIMICKSGVKMIDFGAVRPAIKPYDRIFPALSRNKFYEPDEHGLFIRTYKYSKNDEEGINAALSLFDYLQFTVSDSTPKVLLDSNFDAFSLGLTLGYLAKVATITLESNNIIPHIINALFLHKDIVLDRIKKLKSFIKSRVYLCIPGAAKVLKEMGINHKPEEADGFKRLLVLKSDKNVTASSFLVSLPLSTYCNVIADICAYWIDVVDTFEKVQVNSFLIKEKHLHPLAVVIDPEGSVRLNVFSISYDLPNVTSFTFPLLDSLVHTIECVHKNSLFTSNAQINLHIWTLRNHAIVSSDASQKIKTAVSAVQQFMESIKSIQETSSMSREEGGTLKIAPGLTSMSSLPGQVPTAEGGASKSRTIQRKKATKKPGAGVAKPKAKRASSSFKGINKSKSNPQSTSKSKAVKPK
jgi:serine/threonine protein kinase